MICPACCSPRWVLMEMSVESGHVRRRNQCEACLWRWTSIQRWGESERAVPFVGTAPVAQRKSR